MDKLLLLLNRFKRFAWDFSGVLLLAAAAMTLLALLLPGLSGGFLRWWGGQIRLYLGWGAYWVVLALGSTGWWMMRQQGRTELAQPRWGRILAIEVAAFASLVVLSSVAGLSLDRAEAGLDGGWVGWGLATLLYMPLGSLGDAGRWTLVILSGFIGLICLMGGFGLLADLQAWAHAPARMRPGFNALTGVQASFVEPVRTVPTVQKEQVHKRAPLPQEFRKNLKPQQEDKAESTPRQRDERMPPLSLLSAEQANKPDERTINQMAGLIEKTLFEFGIPAKVVGYRVGPTVTQFAVEPGFLEKEKNGGDGDVVARQKIRVAQIAALQRDLTLALAAQRLRIEAPVPGRPYVGIEVPNARTSMVRLRPILESEAFSKVNVPLAIALGRDVSGQPVVTDLARMPHLLVAGTTGSGKSVCIAAITACLVMNNTPEDLRLVIIDPKMVELMRFNGLPHLLGKVETDLERILVVLRWVVVEMDRRYKLLETTHSRNIDSYNRKQAHRKNESPLPRIVVVIDELADLMMSAPDVTEHNLVRLAQMARATGIHLVVATQRPSTDVVTGLIKANFPARIAFSVASSIDSRVILDTTGADSLLGRGDMLFLPPEASAPVRAQGVMVTDQEVERIIAHWRKIQPPQEDEISPWDEMSENEQILSDRDDLVGRAIELVRGSQRASASMLQRRLRIGYPRAARLMDELEDLGVIGPGQGGGRDREVLIGPDDAIDQDRDSA